MGKVFYSFYISSIFILLIAYCIPLFMVRQEDPKYGWLILCIPILIALFFLGRIGKKKLFQILSNYNREFNIELSAKDKFFKSKKIMSEIRYLMLKNYFIENNIKIKKDEVNKIIDALKSESSNAKYNYRSITIIIGLVSIAFASFLGSFLKFSATSNDLKKIGTNFLIIFITVSIFIFLFEELLAKDLIRDRRNKYQRLIRALENYSINHPD